MEIEQLDNKATYDTTWKNQRLHLLQSWYWGEVKKPQWQLVRLGVYQEKQLLTVLSLQIKQKWGFRFAYLGKIRLPQSQLAEILTQLEKYAREMLNLAFLVLEFDQLAGETAPAAARELDDYYTHVQPPASIQIPLEPAENELWMAMKGNYRRNCKKAQRQGVVISSYLGGDDGFQQFFEVMQEIFHTRTLEARSREYFVKVWQILAAKKAAQIFVAKREDKVLGAYLLAYDELGAYELYGGVTATGRELEAGYLLKWEAIKAAKNNGKKIYDHWGCAPKDSQGNFQKNHSLYQISLFKEGFGGHYCQFLATKVIAINPLFSLLHRLLKLAVPK